MLKDLTIIPSDFQDEQIDEERDELVQFVQYMLDYNLLLPCWFIYFGHKTPLTIDNLLTIFGPVLSNVRWCNIEMTLVEQTHVSVYSQPSRNPHSDYWPCSGMRSNNCSSSMAPRCQRLYIFSTALSWLTGQSRTWTPTQLSSHTTHGCHSCLRTQHSRYVPSYAS